MSNVTTPKKKTAILFDIDDTLYDQVVPFGKAVKKVFPHLADVEPAKLFRRRAFHGEISFHMVLRNEMTMEEMYKYRVQKAFADLGIEVSGEEALAFQEAYEESQKQLELSPGMEKILNYCKTQGVVIGVITNGPADHQMEKALTLGVDRWMPLEHVIVSGQVGIVKPDVRIFRIAEERLGITSDIWFVGDSFTNDVRGAYGAGWHSIWLNRRGKAMPEDGEAVADYVVSDEDQLMEVIRGII